MNEYSNFPPFAYLKIILNSCPESALLYIDLWKRKDYADQFVVQRKDIRNAFLISPTLFRNLILPIVGQGLINFEESPKFFVINLTSFDEIDD